MKRAAAKPVRQVDPGATPEQVAGALLARRPLTHDEKVKRVRTELLMSAGDLAEFTADEIEVTNALIDVVGQPLEPGVP